MIKTWMLELYVNFTSNCSILANFFPNHYCRTHIFKTALLHALPNNIYSILKIKGGGLLPGWVNPPPNSPPVLLIVSDILDSEIHDRTRVRYSYSNLRGSYEIEADLTMH